MQAPERRYATQGTAPPSAPAAYAPHSAGFAAPVSHGGSGGGFASGPRQGAPGGYGAPPSSAHAAQYGPYDPYSHQVPAHYQPPAASAAMSGIIPAAAGSMWQPRPALAAPLGHDESAAHAIQRHPPQQTSASSSSSSAAAHPASGPSASQPTA